jgi:hypothetical protein
MDTWSRPSVAMPNMLTPLHTLSNWHLAFSRGPKRALKSVTPSVEKEPS